MSEKSNNWSPVWAIAIALAAGGTSPWWWSDVKEWLSPNASEPIENHADPKTPTEGEFSVPANSPLGYKFVASHEGKYSFFASGTWSIDPAFPETSAKGIADEADEADERLFLPKAPYGALIMRRKSGQYELVGSNKRINLQTGEPLFFLANDGADAFGDNKGQIKVEWDKL